MPTQRPFRYRHVPTGLYYCLSRDASICVKGPGGEPKRFMRVKSNLSPKGKVYLHYQPRTERQGPYRHGGIPARVDNHIRANEICVARRVSGSSGYGTRHLEGQAATEPRPEDWEIEYLSTDGSPPEREPLYP